MLCKALSDPDCHFPPLLLFVLADILCVSKLYSLSGKIVYLLFPFVHAQFSREWHCYMVLVMLCISNGGLHFYILQLLSVST